MKKFKKLLLLGLLIVAGLFVVGVKSDRLQAPSITSNEVPKPQPLSVEGRYLFNGTVVWARQLEQWSRQADGTMNYAYPFSGLSTFEREKYDGWSADLECASGMEVVSQARAENELVFNCRPEFLPEAAKYFNFMNLANNHSDNLGAAGFEETRQHLAQNGLQAFGHYEPGKLDDICEVMSVPVRVKIDDGSEQKGSLPIAFCAWHYFYRLPQPGEIEHMRQFAELIPVFAFLQMGAEYRPVADELQRGVAHRIIDQGPEFLVANSAHWVQDAEVYKGKLIMYSTGNFIFDQQYNAEVTRSASLDTIMEVAYDENVGKWLELGETCKVLKDNCIEQARALGLTKPSLKLTHAVVAGDNSNKLTKRASAAIQAAVEQRLKWAEIIKALGQ